jgi:adenosylhomocysteine nucleosidase
MTPPRVAAGIVFAVPIEADAFARLAADVVETRGGGLVFHAGTIVGKPVAWCVGGVGREHAARAAQLLLDGHRPRRLVSAGFAGGLDPAVERGSLVRGGSVRGPSGGIPLPLATRDDGPQATGPLIVTVDRIVCTPAEKAALAAATGGSICDMETLAVAEIAAAAGVPCHGLRVVSDAASDHVPPDVGRLAQPQSTARRAGAVLGMVGRRPRAAADLWRLWERAVVDGRSLAAGLAAEIAALGEPAH